MTEFHISIARVAEVAAFLGGRGNPDIISIGLIAKVAEEAGFRTVKRSRCFFDIYDSVSHVGSKSSRSSIVFWGGEGHP